jgi:REP-associated tyrosine transposase
VGHPRRVYLPDISLHVIRRGNNRCAIVRDDDDHTALLRIFKQASSEFDVSVHAFVFMTTHYHLIVTPQREYALPQMMKAVGEQYVRYYNGRYDRIGTLWAGRYKPFFLLDERYWLTCLRYVEQNPWRANMVTASELYRWSSYRVHALGEPSDWLVPHPIYLALGATPAERQRAYRAICGVKLTDDELAEQRHRRRRAIVAKVSNVSDVSDTSDVSGVSDVSDTSAASSISR